MKCLIARFAPTYSKLGVELLKLQVFSLKMMHELPHLDRFQPKYPYAVGIPPESLSQYSFPICDK